jgi:hypothetical protein
VAALGALGTLLSGFGGLLAIFGNLAHVAAMFGFVVCHLDLSSTIRLPLTNSRSRAEFQT